jgi:hypothetical protein
MKYLKIYEDFKNIFTKKSEFDSLINTVYKFGKDLNADIQSVKLYEDVTVIRLYKVGESGIWIQFSNREHIKEISINFGSIEFVATDFLKNIFKKYSTLDNKYYISYSDISKIIREITVENYELYSDTNKYNL